jgi:D-alanyl-D-alanine carboxypeptidase (penicillin-binding protein 5/6)
MSEATTVKPVTKRIYPIPNLYTTEFDKSILSKYAILVDLENRTVVASKNEYTKCYPASLTKIMTVLVALENIDDINKTYTMPADIYDKLLAQDASMAGFEPGEKVTFKDLLYGALLPSGADASMALAKYVSGSEKDFVALMNKKAKDLGIGKTTHFANPTGLHDKNHYSTVADIYVILEHALQNKDFVKIFTAKTYTTSKTTFHPEGINLESTLFSKITEKQIESAWLKGGKTGFTDEAGMCLASLAEKNGKQYILVTAMAKEDSGKTLYPNIEDALYIYPNYLK